MTIVCRVSMYCKALSTSGRTALSRPIWCRKTLELNGPASRGSTTVQPRLLRAIGGAADGERDDDAREPRPSYAELEGEEPPLTLGTELQDRMNKLRTMDQLRELFQGPDTDDLLLRGSILIARHRYPQLNEQEVYDTLDALAARVGALLPERRYPLKVVQTINQVLYQESGFRGNEEDYYNADNSCINRVLERKVGIPITLSLVYMEVARRVGLPMRGLNLPLHFMLQPAAEGVEVLVDAFRGGEVCLLGDAEERIRNLSGENVRLDPQLLQSTEPLAPRTFLLRMLRNLRGIYFNTQQVAMALTMVQYMKVIVSAGLRADERPRRGTAARLSAEDPMMPGLLRDEGLCYFALHRYPEALDVLREYLQLRELGHNITEEERYMVTQVVEEAKRRMLLSDKDQAG